MDHPVMGSGALHVDGNVTAARSVRGLAPLDEARGVVRDVLAAVRNVEHLLRSRNVGARALAKVVPGLQGLCDPLIASIDDILLHVRKMADGPVDEAIAALAAFVGAVCDRLKTALDRASRAGALDAKARLAFEGAIVRAGGELNGVRQLLDLLIESTERYDTELDVEELVQVAFSSPASASTGRDARVRVLATCLSDGSGFQASPRVFMPLLAIAIATVRGEERDPVFVEAVCRAGEPVVITVAREASPSGGREGSAESDELRFEPPAITPASLLCAQTAARLAGGRFAAEPGRVVLSWQRAEA